MPPSTSSLRLRSIERPEAVPVVQGAGSLSRGNHVPEKVTYAELDRRANRVANYLCTLGVGPHVPVGLCLERSPKMTVAILAVLKTGGAYLLLDLSYPGERLAFMLRDAGASVVVAKGLGGESSTFDPGWTALLENTSQVIDVEANQSLIAR